ncbi:alkaline phosphatase family protein [Pseudomonas purpurea]|uniref:alkaline phosphatase family protein n=1 Tax=Pseudomonas purpurea TaxID=3136737 RepID=UPI00326408FC
MSNNWPADIKHVVVLMMENRSFDHLLGDYRNKVDSACEGIGSVPTPSNSVTLASGGSVVITQQQESTDDFSLWAPPPPPLPAKPAKDSEGFDLGHEFDDVVVQLDVTGVDSLTAPLMNGFAQNAYTKARADLKTYKTYAQSMAQRAMNYIPFGETPAGDPLPAIQGLARHYTVCDRWFSSVPGPTWPNRFFAMLGSCNGHLLMPDVKNKTVVSGIKSLIAQFTSESIFSLLRSHGHDVRIYSDGAIPLAALVRGGRQHSSIKSFKQDIHDQALPALSWIEPSYGLLNGTLGPNVSHHPPEDIRFGDQFVGDVFNALSANKAVWDKTLFVLLYDEHGGFHDHVVPPAAVQTDTTSDVNWNNPFTLLGVRVPAIFASPWLKPGLVPWASSSINRQHYDHTSLLAFLCDHFNVPRSALGPRVVAADHFGNAPIWRNAPLTAPIQLDATAVPSRDGLPLTESGLATLSRQVVDTATGYLNGLDPVQIWQNSAHNVRAFLAEHMRGLAAPADTVTLAAPGEDNLEAKLRNLQDLMDTAYPLPAATTLPRATRALLAERQQATAPLKVLCLPGVGYTQAFNEQGGTDANWQDQWRSLIHGQLAQNGRHVEGDDIEFLSFDDQLKGGPDFAQITRGLAILRADATDKDNEVFGSWGLPVNQMLRTTVGATVQWIEDPDLRTDLVQHLLEKIDEFDPQIIFAQGLGSLIGYDALRRSVAKKGSALKRIDGRVFVSFGSPIALPLVMREVWGGRVMRLNDNGRGIRRWFHLYNPNDGLLTRPITSPDSARIDLQTEFTVPLRDDLLDLNHAAQAYLSSPTSQTGLWPQLARDVVAARILEVPAFLSRTGQRKRRALVVGINDYPDPGARLDGCINDTYLISRMLQESGYDAGDIRLLHNERATRANFVERLEWLVEGARAGDERMLFYSGHGTQLPAYGASQEADRMDETLVLYDFDWDDENTHFTDKLFRQFYSHLPFDPDGHGAKLTVMLDCCNAGGMTRGAGRVRGITPPSDIRHRLLRWDPYAGDWDRRPYAADSDGRDFSAHADSSKPQALTRTRRAQGACIGLRPDSTAQLLRQGKLYGHHGPYMPLMLYAARENEKASEYQVGANTYGAFTYAMVEQLRKLHQEDAKLGFDELIKRIGGVLNARSLGQTPEIVGPSGVREAVCPWQISGLGR